MCLLASLAACGGNEPDVASTTTTAPTTTVQDQTTGATETDLVYASWEEGPLTLDMHVPAEPNDAPIVIYLPGRGQTGWSPPMVEGLIEEGTIVFVARYPGSNSSVAQILGDHGSDARAKADSVACAIHFARDQASQLGSTDPLVVLTGFSGGGGLAAHAALFGATLEAGWDAYAAGGGPESQVGCMSTESSTHVDALVGLGGGTYDLYVPIYDGMFGRAYQQELDRELWEFLSSPIGANPELRIRLLHGDSDPGPPYQAVEVFARLLADAGYDMRLGSFAGGHVPPPTELSLSTIMEVIGP
jgi:predicted esterase